jgi:hypothetical protein
MKKKEMITEGNQERERERERENKRNKERKTKTCIQGKIEINV